MIKTHKPRGHVWSHSSAFQQTKEFRNIDFGECVAPQAEVLVEDSDDELPISGRAAKRKRIEKVADDFLNGAPLSISSARPCPQTLRCTVLRNKTTSNESKLNLEAVNVRWNLEEHAAVWEDVENDAEILERLRLSIEADRSICQRKVNPLPDDDGSAVDVEEVEAQASCGRTRRLRRLDISSRPSNEALRQAATLRDTRLHRAQSDVPVYVRRPSSFAKLSETDVEPRSEPCYEDFVTRKDEQGNKWLSRRNSRFSFAQYEENEDSADELRLSGKESLPIPSHILIPPAALQRDQQGLLHATIDSKTSGRSTSSDFETEPVEQLSQALRDLRTAEPVTLAKDRRAKSAGNFTPQQSSPPSRRTRAALTRHSQTAPEPQRLRYTTAQPSRNGSTPFKFHRRKRESAPTGKQKQQEKTAVEQPQQGCNGHTLLSSDNIVVADRRACVSADVETLPPRSPMLDTAFDHDSSFAPTLNMALDGEHCDNLPPNSESEYITPQESGLDSPHLPDHNLERSDEESQQSIQRPIGDQHVASDIKPESWAGTQFLLNKAQRDLMISPEKPSADHTLSNVTKPQTTGKVLEDPTASSPREPLKQLSQEPIQSTQQLLGEFDGWSTVKKPRTVRQDSSGCTPTAIPKKSWTAINETGPQNASRPIIGSSLLTNTAQKRSSSLRFSIQTAQSPLRTGPELDHTGANDSSAEHSTMSLAPPLLTSPRDDEGGLVFHDQDATTRPAFSDETGEVTLDDESLTRGTSFLSFQAAQMRSGSLPEASDLSQMFDDVRGFLDTTYVDLVLSQVP